MDPGVDGGNAAIRGATCLRGDLSVRVAGNDFRFLGINLVDQHFTHSGTSDVARGPVGLAPGTVRVVIDPGVSSS